jgi:hypothetical protein
LCIKIESTIDKSSFGSVWWIIGEEQLGTKPKANSNGKLK